MINDGDWQDKLEGLLIAAGTPGMKQMDIVKKMKNTASAEVIEEYLMALASDGKVQRFTVMTRGRSSRIWRATAALV